MRVVFLFIFNLLAIFSFGQWQWFKPQWKFIYENKEISYGSTFIDSSSYLLTQKLSISYHENFDSIFNDSNCAKELLNQLSDIQFSWFADSIVVKNGKAYVPNTYFKNPYPDTLILPKINPNIIDSFTFRGLRDSLRQFTFYTSLPYQGLLLGYTDSLIDISVVLNDNGTIKLLPKMVLSKTFGLVIQYPLQEIINYWAIKPDSTLQPLTIFNDSLTFGEPLVDFDFFFDLKMGDVLYKKEVVHSAAYYPWEQNKTTKVTFWDSIINISNTDDTLALLVQRTYSNSINSRQLNLVYPKEKFEPFCQNTTPYVISKLDYKWVIFEKGETFLYGNPTPDSLISQVFYVIDVRLPKCGISYPTDVSDGYGFTEGLGLSFIYSGIWNSYSYTQVLGKKSGNKIVGNYENVGLTYVEPIEVRIYPNPVKEYILIEPYSLITEVKIYDLSGREVITVSNPNTSLIDFSLFQSGIYFIDIQMVDGTKSIQQIVKL